MTDPDEAGDGAPGAEGEDGALVACTAAGGRGTVTAPASAGGRLSDGVEY